MLSFSFSLRLFEISILFRLGFTEMTNLDYKENVGSGTVSAAGKNNCSCELRSWHKKKKEKQKSNKKEKYILLTVFILT